MDKQKRVIGCSGSNYLKSSPSSSKLGLTASHEVGLANPVCGNESVWILLCLI